MHCQSHLENSTTAVSRAEIVNAYITHKTLFNATTFQCKID